MSKQYLPHEVEPKWQQRWVENEAFLADDASKKKKYYLLVEFPYPSGERLHVGHARSYCALDAVARLKRLKGENVLYPMGWDAFGLPAENFAIKTGIHPSITTNKNIENSKKQLETWGMSFDWRREITTTDPNYYKWTQWIFLKLYGANLAYRDEISVNWCPSCKINLANEEVVNGACERCGHAVERRVQTQWLLRITKYAEKLLEGLKHVNYRNDINVQQIEWIGRKEGVVISYKVKDREVSICCFTTRPDTNFGASFVVLAPEHPLISDIVAKECEKDVNAYLNLVSKRSELDRMTQEKKKTGVFTGSYAINPLNNSEMPIYIADFVLASFGTGAVVGVPGHDIRDFDFAKLFDLPVIRTVVDSSGDEAEIQNVEQVFEGQGTVVNSDFLNGMSTSKAILAVTKFIEKKGFGEKTVTYHLRDWVFSRQHYWGEPIPIIHCKKCGEVPVPFEDLPVELPHVEKYEPTDTGESPLASIKEWVNVKCPKCDSMSKRETDTMPNWAGSSWYFLRYIDPNNDKMFASEKLLKKWLPVDWYNGGMEHTTLHLLYSRFWHKFMYDQGLVPTPEPYAKRSSHGVVFGPGGKRMSKSDPTSVVNPDDIIEAYGADTLRLYMMFIGPFDQNVAWSNESVAGVRRFLNRVWSLSNTVIESKRIASSDHVARTVHRLLKKVEEDLESTKFNTAVSTLMETTNTLISNKDDVGIDMLKILIQCLYPLAPHISEEIWELSGEKEELHKSTWPTYEESMLADDVVQLAVQVNGKFRGTVSISSDNANDETLVKKKVLLALNMREKYGIDDTWSIIFVKSRLINFVQTKTQ